MSLAARREGKKAGEQMLSGSIAFQYFLFQQLHLFDIVETIDRHAVKIGTT